MNILVYQPGSLGDTLMAIPALRAVRRHYGASANITVLYNVPNDSRATSADVLQGSGLIDFFLPYENRARKNDFIGTYKKLLLLFRLAALKFDAIVYLAPSDRTSSSIGRDSFFFSLARIKDKKGFSITENAKALNPSQLPHETKMLLTRLSTDGIVSTEQDFKIPFFEIPQGSAEKVSNWLKSYGYISEIPLIAICPGGNQPANYWSIDGFFEIGKRLLNEKKVNLVVVGGVREHQIGSQLIARWGSGFNACGEFSIIESSALLKMCAFHIGLDTGTTHLASVLGVPSVALYSGRNPVGQWIPLGDNYKLIRHDVPCAGCRLVECTVSGHPCMQTITIDEVWAKVTEYLNLL
jgi:ADP-heptose:LPS heptosyltransferase